jgi:hypothetical protein
MWKEQPRLELVKDKALEVIQWFPISRNGHHFLRLSDGRKVFFSIFIKKYWIDGTISRYSWLDIMRRIRIVEFFDYMLKDNKIKQQERWNYIIESKFYRMVIGVVGKPKKQRLEMISFYHYL